MRNARHEEGERTGLCWGCSFSSPLPVYLVPTSHSSNPNASALLFQNNRVAAPFPSMTHTTTGLPLLLTASLMLFVGSMSTDSSPTKSPGLLSLPLSSFTLRTMPEKDSEVKPRTEPEALQVDAEADAKSASAHSDRGNLVRDKWTTTRRELWAFYVYYIVRIEKA